MRSSIEAPPPRTGVCSISVSTPNENAAARVPPPEKDSADQVVVLGGPLLEIAMNAASEASIVAGLIDRRIVDRGAADQRQAKSDHWKGRTHTPGRTS